MRTLLRAAVAVGAIAAAAGSAQPAFASCDPIRLDQAQPAPGGGTTPGSVQGVPVYNQGTVGNCFASAAMTMINAYRRSHSVLEGGSSPQQPLGSPLDAAVGIWGEENRNLAAGGGFTCSAFDYLRRVGGTCDMRSFLPVEENPERLLNGGDLDDALVGLRYHFKSYFKTLEQHQCTDSVERATAENIRQFLSNDLSMTQSVIPSIDVVRQYLHEYAARMSASHAHWYSQEANGIASKQIYTLIFHNACDGHRLPLDPGIRCDQSPPIPLHPVPPRLVLDSIDARLNAPNAQPVFINYCSELLHAGTPAAAHAVRGIIDDGSGHRVGADSGCGRHASVIIGRRPRPGGGCQYLIQNSWGGQPTDCWQYGSAGWDCESGKVWVDESALEPNIYGYGGLEWTGPPAPPVSSSPVPHASDNPYSSF